MNDGEETGYAEQVEIPVDSMLSLEEVDIGSEASPYKKQESGRIKNTWENILEHDPRIRAPLGEIDAILAENSHNLEAHIAGEDYLAVSRGQKTSPELLHLRIDQSPHQLDDTGNHFFRNMEERDKLYHVEEAPIAFEITDLFDETVQIETGTRYLEVHAPTEQSFFNDYYMRALEHLEADYVPEDSSIYENID